MLSSRSLKFLALGCAMLASACDRESGQKAQPPASSAASAQAGQIDRSHKGSQLPDFQLKDPSGKELNLADLKGKPVLINLWATWCAPCVAELPQLDKLAADKPGIKVLTVNQDSQNLEKVGPFLSQKGGKNLPAWLNPDMSLAFQFGFETYPATVFFDAQGREVWRIQGERDWTGEDTKALLEEGG